VSRPPAFVILLFFLGGCGLSAEDSRMLLAGTQAAAGVSGLQRLELLSVTCARIPDCARGCEPVFEGMAHADPADELVLLRRCPDVAAVVPAEPGPRQIEASTRFFLSRLSPLAPKAIKTLGSKDGARVQCFLRALEENRGGSGC